MLSRRLFKPFMFTIILFTACSQEDSSNAAHSSYPTDCPAYSVDLATPVSPACVPSKILQGEPCPTIGLRNRFEPKYLCWFAQMRRQTFAFSYVNPKMPPGIWYDLSDPSTSLPAVVILDSGVNDDEEFVNVHFDYQPFSNLVFANAINVFRTHSQADETVTMTFDPPPGSPENNILFADPRKGREVRFSPPFDDYTTCKKNADNSGFCTIAVRVK